VFDLEREVASWSEAVYADRCRASGSVAELRDHLHCEIDRAKAEGLSDEAAFAAAVAKLGATPELAAEDSKNRSLLAAACAAAARHERLESSARNRWLLVAHAILWASVIIAVSLFLSKSTLRNTIAMLLVLVMVPSWLASEQILRAALRRRPAGRAR
jgi:hypothetical protein